MTFDRETRVGIVGAGRLGGSLARALHRAGRVLVLVSRRDRAGARALADTLPGVTGTDDAQEVVDGADIVVLAVADAHIEPLADTLRFRSGQGVVHCSGATPVAVLDAARSRGAMTGGLHPLQTFPADDGVDRFRGITIGIESSDGPLLEWLRGLAEALGGTPLVLTKELRSVYHAVAFMVSGLLTTYVASAAGLWSRHGLAPEQALAALTPLLERSLADLRERGVGESLTGPIVRDDLEVVRSHLVALDQSGPELLRAYAALGLVHLAAARRGGSAPDASSERSRIEGVLHDALAELAVASGPAHHPRSADATDA